MARQERQRPQVRTISDITIENGKVSLFFFFFFGCWYTLLVGRLPLEILPLFQQSGINFQCNKLQ